MLLFDLSIIAIRKKRDKKTRIEMISKFKKPPLVGRFFVTIYQRVFFMKKALISIANFFVKRRFFFQRLAMAIFTLFVTTILVFFVLKLTPGDVVFNYAQSLQARLGCDWEYAYSLATQTLGYDPNASVFVQLGGFFESLFRGEFGVSLYNDSITGIKLIAQRLPWTLFISTIALLISFVLGTALGALMARKRNSWVESAGNSYIILASAIPDYLLGTLLLVAFASQLRIFPSNGNYDANLVTPGFNLPFIGNVIWHAALPIIAYVISGTCNWTMLMRGNAIGVLGEDYILCAKARGISENRIINRYMKRNAMLPLVTALALSFAGLFGGSALMESVFNYPGLGLEFGTRIGMRDYFVVQGILFFTSSIVILANLVVDYLYSLLDPRVRRNG